MVLLSAPDVQMAGGAGRRPGRHRMRRPASGAGRAADGSRHEFA